MIPNTSLVIYAWFALAPFLFAWLPARRAIIAGYVLAWLFLPIAVIDTPFVDIDKYVATSVGVIIGLVAFAKRHVIKRRLSYWDLPIIIWSLCPIATSFENELGFYDGFSAAAHRMLMWGVPYLIARVYLSDAAGVRDVAIGIFCGGLIYVPLCLWEIRMSPQLHQQLYGYHQHSFLQTMRTIGGYRPMVFMHHGLMVGLWMASASLIGIVLWKSGALKRVAGWPIKWLAIALLVTTIMCQSVGAIVLLATGLALYAGLKRYGRVGIAALMFLPVLYCGLRVTGQWDGQVMVELTSTFSEERASSLEYRLVQEEFLAERAWQRPLLGWGGFNRAFPPPNASDLRPAVSDSLWIVVYGMNGLMGLASIILTILAPIYALTRRWKPEGWTHPQRAPAAALALVLGMYLMDGMVNMMVNPIFMLAAGSLTGLAIAARAPAPVQVTSTGERTVPAT
ncbi:MAG: O-antigen ligase domain-containing protein [Planctomycetes bacterium]|nr:O-antigen ligase domain-containing protein [Planctomycetota bacterium]